jgi:hypothetical protein
LILSHPYIGNNGGKINEYFTLRSALRVLVFFILFFFSAWSFLIHPLCQTPTHLCHTHDITVSSRDVGSLHCKVYCNQGIIIVCTFHFVHCMMPSQPSFTVIYPSLCVDSYFQDELQANLWFASVKLRYHRPNIIRSYQHISL